MNQKNEESIKTLHIPPKLEKYHSPYSPIRNPTTVFILRNKIYLVLALLVTITLLFLSQRTLSLPPPINNLKTSSPVFVGRADYLLRLHNELLDSPNDAADKIRCLWGKGGFGKSELAIQFAHVNQNQFSLIWSFCCDSPEQMNQGYRDLAERLLIFVSSDPIEKVRQKVHHYLENIPSELPWLLIFDNVESDFIDYPKKGGVIVITSQKKVLPDSYLIEIQPFSKKEGLELLKKITQEKAGEVMHQLVDDLEGIPLLINYAAYYIKTTPGCTIHEYRNLFSSHFFEKEGPLWSEMDVNKRYQKSLALAWSYSIQYLEKECPHAGKLLSVCSYLHPEQIPIAWLQEWSHDLNLDADHMFKLLQDYGLVRYEEKNKTFSIHRFLQYIIREARVKTFIEDLNYALTFLAGHANDYDLLNMPTWKEGKIWYLHACALRKWIEADPSEQVHPPLLKASFYNGLATWYSHIGLYKEALILDYNVLKLKELTSDKSAEDLCNTYNRIANDQYNLGKYSEAWEYCKKSQEILSQCSKELSLYYAQSFYIQSRILFEQGRCQEALECQNKCLKIYRKNYHENHVWIGRVLHGKALCLQELGNNEEALKIRSDIDKIYKNTCGEQHPFYAFNLNGMGWMFYEKKMYGKALHNFSKALSIMKISKGAEHPDICFPLIGMGECYSKMNRYKDAKKAFKSALEIGLPCYGKNSRVITWANRGLGQTYLENGRVEKGLEYLVSSLESGSQLYKNNPSMMRILKNFLKFQTKL